MKTKINLSKGRYIIIRNAEIIGNKIILKDNIDIRIMNFKGKAKNIWGRWFKLENVDIILSSATEIILYEDCEAIVYHPKWINPHERIIKA